MVILIGYTDRVYPWFIWVGVSTNTVAAPLAIALTGFADLLSSVPAFLIVLICVNLLAAPKSDEGGRNLWLKLHASVVKKENRLPPFLWTLEFGLWTKPLRNPIGHHFSDGIPVCV